MRTKEEQKEYDLHKCKHFNGMSNDACDKNILYSYVGDMTGIKSPVRVYPVPCLLHGKHLSCELREYPTVEEWEAKERKLKILLKNMMTARKAIVEHDKNRLGVICELDCPVCNTGRLHYSIARSNGHIHAKCSTKDCVSWIE